MNRFSICLLGFLLAGMMRSDAQGYQGVNGSPYTGSTAVFNNPAASVNSAYKWDLTLFSVQAKASTNSIFIDKTGLRFDSGIRSHFIHLNADVSFLNFLYRPDEKSAFNFNLRGRAYAHSKTLPVNIDESITGIHDLLVTNRSTPFLQGYVTHTGWLEGDLNYSQVIMQNSQSKFTAGATLQIMKGLSGAYIKINRLSYIESKNTNDTTYTFTDGNGGFAYSNNYDRIAGQNNSFLGKAKLGLGLSLGIEYLLYDSYDNSSTNTNTNYAWKFGASIMDIGSNSFAPSTNSTVLSGPIPTMPDNLIDAKLQSPQSLQELRDSLATIFNNASTITDNFSISNPTRLVINIDRNFGNHFYLNGEMSLNFFSTAALRKLHSRELNLFTITPRWETMALGVYLPLQYNTQGQLWMGAAIKLGPLTMGIHSFGILKKDPRLNGGGYMMLSIHPFEKKQEATVFDCKR